ncbi:lipopolysaccharide transport periplasmic protein LptA [Leucothrix sargassi]|nr:lipopolysaccharide transport periplasmic protein LptA [Leucothrix sargassi]
MYKQNLIPLNKSIIAFTLILFSTPSMALRDDVTKPVKIEADTIVFNKAKGFGKYSGNVVIVQGSLQIRAADIEISAPNSQIKLITAKGSPVRFQQTMDDGKVAKGQANLLRYAVDEKKLVLDGSATLSQNNDQFSSQHIEYSTRTGELKAGVAKVNGQNTKAKGRVSAIFYPSNSAQ